MKDQPPPPNHAEAFTTVYRASYGDVVRFIQRRAPANEVDDVVAETFAVAWRRIADLPPVDDDARAWIFGIARMLLLGQRRSTSRRRNLEVRLAAVTTVVDTLPPASTALDRVSLAAAFRSLSAPRQEALALTVFEGMTTSQAAAVLGISSAAVRLRVSRARRALRRQLADPAAPDGSASEATQSAPSTRTRPKEAHTS